MTSHARQAFRGYSGVSGGDLLEWEGDSPAGTEPGLVLQPSPSLSMATPPRARSRNRSSSAM